MYSKGRSVHSLKTSEKNFIINSITKILTNNDKDVQDELTKFALDTGLIVRPINIKET